MHGFNLCLESIMAGPLARRIAVRGQTVATYIRASPPAAAAVAKAAQAQNIKGTVLSGNATRFSSVVMMLESILRLRPALTAAVDSPDYRFKAEVRNIINDRQDPMTASQCVMNV